MLDIGGGFGADYETAQTPPASEYAHRIVPLLQDRVRAGLQVILEPGRTITANAGVLLVRVLYVKRSGLKTFAICDGGLNTLLRPSYSDAFHFIQPCRVAAASRRARLPARIGPAWRAPRDRSTPGAAEVPFWPATS